MWPVIPAEKRGVVASFWQPAGTVDIPGKGELPQRFAQDAFAGSAGKKLPWTYEGSRLGEATVLAVKVAPDGSGATFTVELEAAGPPSE